MTTSNKAKMENTVELSRTKKIVFSLILLVFVLTIFELSARFYLRKSQGWAGGPLLQYVFDPYKNVMPTPNYVDVRGVKHNAQGFRRSTNVSLKKPDGTFRIF